MNQKLLNKILLIILIIETVLVAGVIGYRLGERKNVQPPVYNINIYVDPSMIHYKEENNPESNTEPVPDKQLIIDDELSFTDEEIDYISKTVWGEARGLSKMEQAGVVWTILNRLDNGRFGDSIIDVITAPNQFAGYKSSHPVDSDIRNLAVDVLERYELEQDGIKDVGRVLPKTYLYFRGTGKKNLFIEKWNSNDIWDWSLPSPYV